MKLRVVLADDHPFVLLGIRSALLAEDDIEVVGEACGARELLQTLETVPCDVVLTDLNMPPASGEAEDGQGHAHLSPGIQRELAAAACAPDTCVPRLTPRESEVIRKFASGSSITEIARALVRDVRTVSSQKRDAMAKLGVSNDAGTLRLCQGARTFMNLLSSPLADHAAVAAASRRTMHEHERRAALAKAARRESRRPRSA